MRCRQTLAAFTTNFRRFHASGIRNSWRSVRPVSRARKANRLRPCSSHAHRTGLLFARTSTRPVILSENGFRIVESDSLFRVACHVCTVTMPRRWAKPTHFQNAPCESYRSQQTSSCRTSRQRLLESTSLYAAFGNSLSL